MGNCIAVSNDDAQVDFFHLYLTVAHGVFKQDPLFWMVRPQPMDQTKYFQVQVRERHRLEKLPSLHMESEWWLPVSKKIAQKIQTFAEILDPQIRNHH